MSKKGEKMKKCVLINLSVLLLVVAVIFVSRADLHAAVGDPVPGAEIYIEQEPNDEPIANAVTDKEGIFRFENLCGVEAGEYALKFNLSNVKGIDKETLKRSKFHVFFKIGKYIGPEGKELIIHYTKVLIEGRNICINDNNVAFRFVLTSDILFKIKQAAAKATGNKGGFAVGGFSIS